MIKKDIVLKITDMTGIKQVDVKTIVQKTFDAIANGQAGREGRYQRNDGGAD